MIICDCNLQECILLEKAIYDYCRDKTIPVQLRFCEDWQTLNRKLKEKPADAIIIALDGVAGLDIITGLKLQTGKLIWFSDLDFAIQAYRLCIPYFNQKPITHNKVIQALDHTQAN